MVSEGELRRALAAGVPADKIVFAGVGKQPSEMATALDAGILQFNVESLPELEALSRVAQDKGLKAPVALRINPDVDALTHAKISTGKAENKFGIDIPSLRGFPRFSGGTARRADRRAGRAHRLPDHGRQSLPAKPSRGWCPSSWNCATPAGRWSGWIWAAAWASLIRVTQRRTSPAMPRSSGKRPRALTPN